MTHGFTKPQEGAQVPREGKQQSAPLKEFCSCKCQICRVEINFLCSLPQDIIIPSDIWGYFSLKK